MDRSFCSSADFESRPRKLLSLTIIEDEISVVCDKASLDFFPSDERPASNIWKLIKVDDGPLGFGMLYFNYLLNSHDL
jgi:hypothetical protein